jgi:hypothetical protein
MSIQSICAEIAIAEAIRRSELEIMAPAAEDKRTKPTLWRNKDFLLLWGGQGVCTDTATKLLLNLISTLPACITGMAINPDFRAIDLLIIEGGLVPKNGKSAFRQGDYQIISLPLRCGSAVEPGAKWERSGFGDRNYALLRRVRPIERHHCALTIVRSQVSVDP